jgi:hypothetical protein
VAVPEAVTTWKGRACARPSAGGSGRLALLALATLAVLVLSLLLSAGRAAAATWTGGQTASYTVRVDDGPAYRVTVKVPIGLTIRVQRDPPAMGSQLELAVMTGHCFSGHPADAHLDGDTVDEAVREVPIGLDRFSDAGRGAGRVRWAEFEGTSLGEKSYELYAIHPRVATKDFFGKQYYGFHATTFCMSRETARELVSTVRITPLKRGGRGLG